MYCHLMTMKNKKSVWRYLLCSLLFAWVVLAEPNNTMAANGRSIVGIANPAKNAITNSWTISLSAFSVASSSDGSKVAVSVSPLCANSGKAGYFSQGGWEVEGGSPVCTEKGKLYLLGSKGQRLWEFPGKDDKDVVAVYGVSISADGRYIGASVGREPCVDEIWQIDSMEYVDVLSTGPAIVSKDLWLASATQSLASYKMEMEPQIHTLDGKHEIFEKNGAFYLRTYSLPRKARLCVRETVLFDGDGKKLWSRPGRGTPKISPDGKYLLSIPYSSRSSANRIYGGVWQLFNTKGDVSAEKVVVSLADAIDASFEGGDAFARGQFSDDGGQFVLAGKLWKYDDGKPKAVSAYSSVKLLSRSGRYIVSTGDLRKLDSSGKTVFPFPYETEEINGRSDTILFGLEPFFETEVHPKVALFERYVAIIEGHVDGDPDGNDAPIDRVLGKVKILDLNNMEAVAEVGGNFTMVYALGTGRLILLAMSQTVPLVYMIYRAGLIGGV